MRLGSPGSTVVPSPQLQALPPGMLFVLVETKPHSQTPHQKALRGLTGPHSASGASGNVATSTRLAGPLVQGLEPAEQGGPCSGSPRPPH